jgi:hypothetical protein
MLRTALCALATLALAPACSVTTTYRNTIDSSQPLMPEDLGLQKYVLRAEVTPEEVAVYHTKVTEEDGSLRERWHVEWTKTGFVKKSILYGECGGLLIPENRFVVNADGVAIKIIEVDRRLDWRSSTSMSQGSSSPANFAISYCQYGKNDKPEKLLYKAEFSLYSMSLSDAKKRFPGLKANDTGFGWLSLTAPLPPAP